MMIQLIGEFMKKWGSKLSVMFGLLFIGITFVFQLKGIDSYQYYDQRRYNAVIEVPIVVNYFVGLILIVCGFRREWLQELKRKMKR